MGATKKLIKHFRNLMDTRVPSPSSGTHQGAQVLKPLTVILLGLLTSHRKGIIRQSFTVFRATLSTLAILSGGLLFTHSAYAASYINVSSGAPDGLVSFSKVQPSSSGEVSTASDTLTINTNCSAGYNVYVSAINGGETSLVNDSASAAAAGNNTISASSATIGGTAVELSANTWGINANNTDVSDGRYFGLPAYSSAIGSALVVKSDVETESTVPIYYGAKVTTTLAPGSYNGDVLYTVLSSTSCSVYTIIFNANGGSGEMDNQSINVGQATDLSANTFTRSGYTFLGWSNSANGKTGTAVDGVGTAADVDYENEESVTDISDFNTTKTLYAIWEVEADGDMQSWTGCSALSANQIVRLKDLRDNTVYAVKKLPDGKCWMMQNLTIGSSGSTNAQRTLTSANTNIDNNTTYYLPPAGKQGDITSSATLSSTTAANFITSNDNQAKTQFRSKDSSILNDSDTGYYNFYTATLGFSYYNDGKSSGTSTRDICPKGWRMPKTTDSGTNVTTIGSANDFTYLATRYNSSTGWNGTSTGTSGYSYYNNNTVVKNPMYLEAASPLATSTQNNYAGFSYSGVWDGTGTSASYVGSYGFYWSASVYDTNYGYYLRFDLSGVFPQYFNYKYGGLAVRCIAQNNYTVSYSTNGGTGSPSKSSDSIYETGSITTAAQGTLTKSGSSFLGWSLDQNATSATYAANSAVDVSALISAAGSPASGSTITLYAVWSVPDDGNLGTMQSFNCDSLTPGHTATVTDSRDNQAYSVYRTPTDNAATNVAGKCIMTKDLNLGAVASASGSSSAIVANGTMTLSPNDSNFTTPTGSGESITVPTSNVTVKMAWGTSDSYSNKTYHANGTGNYAGRGYYSWGASMVACPKGWRLPTSDELNNNSSSWNASTTGISKAVNNSLSTLQSSPWSFVLGGYYYNGFGNAPSNGYYWSSTQNGSTNSYYLFLYSSNGLVRDYKDKRHGFAVRCIADPTMQGTSANDLPENATTSLVDSRDGQSYTVYHWPSTGTAGTDYPTDMAGYAIMTQDLALGYVTGGSVTKGANLSLDTSTSASSGTITARTSSSNWSTDNTDSNLQYFNGQNATYGTHSYYSYGAAQKVCPKGWRPPTNAEWGYIQTFMGGDNSTGSSKIRGAPYNFVLGGQFTSSGWNSVGSGGYYWSSIQSSSAFGYRLFFGTSGLDTGSATKGRGFSVRCIAS